MIDYQQRAARYYNAWVKNKVFKMGGLIMRKAKASKPTEVGKLSPKWEGPYRIIKVVRPGAYQLQHLDKSIIPQAWNSENL